MQRIRRDGFLYAGRTATDQAWIKGAENEFGGYNWKLNDYGEK